VAVYNHYKRIQAGEKNRDDIELAPAGLPAVLPFAA
jgi:ATP-dependent protease Clp ATPase subunit